jgi:hypothetical protein
MYTVQGSNVSSYPVPQQGKSFTVVWRQGTPENCRWNPCLPVAAKDEATKQAAEITLMGYKCIIFDTYQYRSIGGPVGWGSD